MRISDWSSDVCSSDLRTADARSGRLIQGVPNGSVRIVNSLAVKGRSKMNGPAPGLGSAVLRHEIQGQGALEDRLEARIGQGLRLQHRGFDRTPAQFVEIGRAHV